MDNVYAVTRFILVGALTRNLIMTIVNPLCAGFLPPYY